MDLVFCGTPQFAVPTLNALHSAGHNVKLVVSQPDRPAGRGGKIAPTPVKQRALELGIPVVQPEKIKSNADFRTQLHAIAPQAIIVVAYGRLIPKWMLDLPPLGNLNLHGSLLPKYRGAAPIQWAIARGETVTGVTTMKLDEGMDTGAILLQKDVPIAPDDTAAALLPRLAEIGALLMVETLAQLAAGNLEPRAQDGARATYAPLLKKEDGRIDFSLTATEIVNRLRGFQPWPGAYTRFRGKNLEIVSARVLTQSNIQPAKLKADGPNLFAGCGSNTAIEILELKPEGKNLMKARAFINGYQPQSGEALGE
jgi:methionyl-tRNA formyltransferase